MCMHCRRTRRTEEGDIWDWVPEFLAKPPDNVSHGLNSPTSVACLRVGRGRGSAPGTIRFTLVTVAHGPGLKFQAARRSYR